MSIKLALLGKNIKHSKSKSIYEKILSNNINYTLIDCESESDIPSLEELKHKYQGVSITAPYKSFFVKDVELVNHELKFINTLVFKGSKIYGENTDFLGVLDILKEYLTQKKLTHALIMGDGAMSECLVLACQKIQMSYQVLSRKNNQLPKIDEYITKYKENILVINACSREFILDSSNKNFHFWDLNYNMKDHLALAQKQSLSYQDGLLLLELQAKYALKLWHI